MSSAISESTLNQHFVQFSQGEEAGLACIYRSFHRRLLCHGLRIVDDQFVVNSAIQEAFLKAWNFRGRLNSLLHTYRFIRLNVTWNCYDYYRSNDKQRHIFYTENIDQYADTVYQQNNDADNSTITKDKLNKIYGAIPYLQPTEKTIFILHFKYGLTAKQISKRFAVTHQGVSHELQAILKKVKKVIYPEKKLSAPATCINHKKIIYSERLQGETLKIFRLRYENKHSFEAIASQMHLPVAHVQQHYIAAHNILSQMTSNATH